MRRDDYTTQGECLSAMMSRIKREGSKELQNNANNLYDEIFSLLIKIKDLYITEFSRPLRNVVENHDNDDYIGYLTQYDGTNVNRDIYCELSELTGDCEDEEKWVYDLGTDIDEDGEIHRYYKTTD